MGERVWYNSGMLKFVITAFIILYVAIGYSAFAAEPKATAGMTPTEALSALQELVPDVKVLEVSATPVQGIFEVAVETEGRKGIIYLDSSRKYLITGSIVHIPTKQNLTHQRFSEINKVNVSEIPLADALIMGEKNAPKKVIVFTDPDCPYCAKLHWEMKKILEQRKDIAFFIKLYPLPMHKDAYGKSKAIVCEKSLALLDDAFERKPVEPGKCETSAIEDNLKLAEKLGIRGTPAIILPNGIIIPGYQDAPSLIDAIDKAS